MGGLIKLSNFSKLGPYAEMFGQGLAITVMLSVGTVLVGAVLGVILALMRMSDLRPFRALGLDKEGHLRGPGGQIAFTQLLPSNPNYSPIDIGGEDETRCVKILGKAVAVRFML